MCFMIVGVGYERIVSRTLGGWVKQGTRVDIIPSRSAGWYAEDEPVSFLASVLGVVLILLLFRLISRRS